MVDVRGDVLRLLQLAKLQLGMDLQPKLSLRRQLMSLSLKYNELGFGQGHGLFIIFPIA